MKHNRFIALDIETTGLEKDSNDIIEIGLALFENELLKDTYSSFIKPNTNIPKRIEELTGISNKTVEHAPKINEVIDDIKGFIGNNIIVAHNANFDIYFIKKHIPELDNEVADTLLLSRILLPQEHRFSLSMLIELFGIENHAAHRALYDAIACGELFLKLIPYGGGIKENEWTILKDAEKYNPCGINILYNFERHNSKDIPLSLKNYFLHGKSAVSKKKDSIENIFSKDGYIGEKLSNFENRNQQMTLAKDIMDSLNRNEFLITESGTGTGKTFAYLFPSVQYSLENNKRIIISTQTKSLQNQLFEKDLPFVFNYFDNIPSAQILKGRGNYICLFKWQELLDYMPVLSKFDVELIQKLIIWVSRTKSGDIDEISNIDMQRENYLWNKIKCDDFFCLKAKCPFYKDCFFINARRNARKANIVIINHSLLFSDAKNVNIILGQYKDLIIDEAHNIEKSATTNIGVTLSLKELEFILGSLSSKKSVFIKHLKKSIDVAIVNKINRISSDMLSHINYVFYLARDKYIENIKNRPLRYNNIVDLLKTMDESFNNIMPLFTTLINIFHESEKLLSKNNDLEIRLNLESKRMEIEELQSKINKLFIPYDDNTCYYMEYNERTKSIKLSGVPIQIGQILEDILYSKVDSIITTTGTCSINNEFSYFLERTGLNLYEEKSITKIYKSPFDYDSQLKTVICEFIPSPTDPSYYNDITMAIKAIVQSIPRKTMILTTSYHMLNELYDSLFPFTENLGIQLLAQGKGRSRSRIIDKFKSSHQALLLGTDSFWEGIDLPGKMLETLIIPKLPFPVPDNPIVESRSNKLNEMGKKAFDEYIVPEMILKTKQGSGRLIRTTYDRGILFILDSRIYSRNYGKRVLNEIPGKLHRVSSFYMFSQFLKGKENETD